uniref:Myotubularin-related protein 5 n=1 Tax=Caenorhabditis japonica TaxID=281687 RepID=A0A8R1HJZ7_CAEJA
MEFPNGPRTPEEKPSNRYDDDSDDGGLLDASAVPMSADPIAQRFPGIAPGQPILDDGGALPSEMFNAETAAAIFQEMDEAAAREEAARVAREAEERNAAALTAGLLFEDDDDVSVPRNPPKTPPLEPGMEPLPGELGFVDSEVATAEVAAPEVAAPEVVAPEVVAPEVVAEDADHESDGEIPSRPRTWEEDEKTSNMKAVSIVLISQNFHPKAFKEILLEISNDIRAPEFSCSSELIRFLTEELIEEGSTVDIRTKTLNVELGFEFYPALPVTGRDVAMLFQILGFRNVVNIVHALLSDCRIVLASSSLMRLSRCQNAILSLLYPFVYVHSCVTILPDSLGEVLESPTPFLIGVLTEFVTNFGEGNIVVYLDNGEVQIPDNTEILKSEDYYYNSLHHRLRNVLFPTTSQEDLAIPKDERVPVDEFVLDKKLRACFILYFAELLYGYQYYILYTRIKGNFEKKRTASLSFHVGAFRGFRRLTDPMSSCLLKSVHFQTFILSRALPRRKHDLFDEISCFKELDQLVYKQAANAFESKKIIEHISCELVQKERFMEKCSARKQELFTKIYWKAGMKLLESNNSVIHTIKPKMRNNVLLQAVLPIVNIHVAYHANQFDAYAHRIEALRNCITSIFESKAGFASKSLDAVKTSMRFAPLRIELCRLLNQKSSTNFLLTDKQFEDVALLMNSALQGECEEDNDGVVRSLMYLSNVFSRKLSQGIQQYMYTAIQEHKVWKNQRFWTSCFYYEVHEMLFSEMLKKDRKITESLWCHTLRPCAMEMIDMDDTDQEELVRQENEMIQAQAKHFANLMICLQIPLTEEFFDHEENNSKLQKEKCRFIAYTLDSILGVTGRINGLSLQKIETYVEAHVESLRDVYLELATGEHLKKGNFDPILVCHSEFLLCDPINCYLLPSTEDSEMSLNRLENVLPAEGSLFLTNYRVIFKGKSVDLNVSNATIVQTLPLYSVESWKKLTSKKLVPSLLIEKGVRIEHIIAIHSTCVATITVTFDEDETNNTIIEKFLETIDANCHNSFAFYSTRKEIKVTDNSSHKFGTLNSAIRGLTKKKIDNRRIRNSSSQRGSIQLTLDKMDELEHLKKNAHLRYAVIDYPRLGLNSKTVNLRMSASNLVYTVCPSYPGNFIVPSETNESEIAKVAKGFVDHRLPVVVWMHENGSLLIRASAFTSTDMVKKLKKVVNYRRATPKLTGSINGSLQTLNSKTSSNEESSSNVVAGAEIKSAEVQVNYFAKLASSSQMVLSYSLPSMYADKSNVFNESCSSNGVSKRNGSHEAFTITSNGLPPPRVHRKALYVLLEKGHPVKIPADINAEVVMVRIVKESELRKAHQKARQIHSKEVQSDKKVSYLENWNSSNWPQCVSRMLELSNSIVALISLYNSSVAICLESGRSVTPILSSLSQLLSDPFYRTCDGFQILVEKEWLAFGHCFHKETEMCSSSFMCFLDCVHQVAQQFPTVFEFSDFFLNFIAYHSTSGYFRTFIEDCEEKRLQSDANEFYLPDDLTSINVWEYIKLRNRMTTTFINDMYEQFGDVIVPSSSLSRIQMWQFLTETHLRYGSPYDIESAYHERKLVDPDMEEELWMSVDNDNEQNRFKKPIKSCERDANTSAIIKALQKSILIELFEASEKKNTSTTENIGKETVHVLIPFNVGASPVKCYCCTNILTRWSKAVQCKKCRIHVHEGCINRNITIGNVSHTWEEKPMEEIKLPPAAIQFSTPLSEKIAYSPNTTLTRESLSPPLVPVIPPLCTGYLSKRGAKLKLWVPRFFVLYPDLPKIFYYEEFEKWKCAEKPLGSIDLIEFKSFTLEQTGRRGIIELIVKNRSYRFLSENVNEAVRWKECIEQVIRD